MDARKAYGLAIFEKEDQMEKVDDAHYLVQSQSTDEKYDVNRVRSSWTCSCWDFVSGHNCCKHVYAVGFSMSIVEEERPKTVLEPAKPDMCPYCMSGGAKKKGFQKNNSGSIQKYQCRSCSKYFSTNLGFENMHASPETVTAAMDLYFSGMSYRAIRRQLGLHWVDVSHVTVYNWVDKYVKVMDGYLKGHQPQVGDKWHADEMWIKVRKDRKYLFMMIDSKTRFLISHEVADTKDKHDARSLLRVGREIAGKRPLVFVTDGLPAYQDASRRCSAPERSRRRST